MHSGTLSPNSPPPTLVKLNWRNEAAMPTLIAEDGELRQHRPRLRRLLEQSDGPVRIASPYVTHRELLIGAPNRDIRLLTTLLPMDIVSGATSIETLRAFLKAKVRCKFLPDRPRFHAKVYIFGTHKAPWSRPQISRITH